MTFDELRHLQLEDVIRWPWKTKLIAIAILIVVLGVIVWWKFIAPENSKYHQLKAQEASLKIKVRQKQSISASLPEYQAQIKVMDQRFQHFLQQLPNRTQIPSLLDSVTMAGRSRGLNFELFQPANEVDKNFYAEIPVKLKVIGTYNDMGKFTAAVAAMPRIVTISNITITRAPEPASPPAGSSSMAMNIANAQSSQKLIMQCTATTYRYLNHKKPIHSMGNQTVEGSK